MLRHPLNDYPLDCSRVYETQECLERNLDFCQQSDFVAVREAYSRVRQPILAAVLACDVTVTVVCLTDALLTFRMCEMSGCYANVGLIMFSCYVHVCKQCSVAIFRW